MNDISGEYKMNKKLFERCIKNKEEEPLCYRFKKGLSD